MKILLSVAILSAALAVVMAQHSKGDHDRTLALLHCSEQTGIDIEKGNQIMLGDIRDRSREAKV